MESHFASAVVADFESGRSLSAAALAHVLGCEQCRAEISGHRLVMVDQPASYGPVFDRIANRIPELRDQIAVNRRAAAVAVAALRGGALESNGLPMSPDTIDALIDEIDELAGGDLDRRVALARLGVEVAGKLPNTAQGSDARALAHATLGRMLRVHWDLVAAAEQMQIAQACRARGGDRSVAARVQTMHASLLIDAGHFGEAIERLEDAERLAAAGHGDDLPIVLATKGRALTEAGRHREANETNLKLLCSIDGEAKPRLALIALHNLALGYIETSELDQAEALIDGAELAYETLFAPRDRVRLLWARARLAAARDHLEEAEQFYLATMKAFLAEDSDVDVAFCALELALIYVKQGRQEELVDLMARMLPIFTSRQIHKDALVALSTLRRAVAEQRATAAFVQRTKGFFEAALRKPPAAAGKV